MIGRKGHNTAITEANTDGLYWGPYGPLLMGRGLGWALKAGPIAHCRLGYGLELRAQPGPLRRSNICVSLSLVAIE
jgi:hypothetical protein